MAQTKHEKETAEKTVAGENDCPFCKRSNAMCAGSRSCGGSLKAQRRREAEEKGIV
jgi:hypothetical protein